MDKPKSLDELTNDDYKYPLAKRAKGFQRFVRRLDQIVQTLFARHLSSSKHILESVKARYATDAEIIFYKDYIKKGLFRHEQYTLEYVLPKLPNFPLKALVIGAGTGREAIALEKIGFEVDAIDNCQQMIEAAIEMKSIYHSRVNYWQQDILDDPQLPQKYDLIFHTGGLGNHTPTETLRIKLMTISRKFLSPSGYVICTPEIWKLKRFGMNWFVSLILRLRWSKSQQWKKGDSIRAFFGNHNNTRSVIYFHYYQSIEEVQQELATGGFEGIMIPNSEVWACRPL